jgi:hypothetical protein
VFRVLPQPTDAQLREIKRWFWLTTLSGYFSGWDSGQMTQDTRQIRAFAEGGADTLGEGGVVPSSSLWRMKPFRANSAVSKMLGLILAHQGPTDLVNGQKIDVDKSLAWSNDKEYHHFFPQAHLRRKSIGANASNVVGNIVLLTSASNIQISDSSPSDYLQRIMDASGRAELVRRLESNLVPESALDAALADDYTAFLEARSQFLHQHVQALTGPIDVVEPTPEDDDSDEDMSD